MQFQLKKKGTTLFKEINVHNISEHEINTREMTRMPQLKTENLINAVWLNRLTKSV